MSSIDRRQFRQLMGATMSALKVNLAEALAIPAASGTGTIQDVEHIVILMQENRPFDHHFGTLGGVRGFNDPRAVNINHRRRGSNVHVSACRSHRSRTGQLFGPGSRRSCHAGGLTRSFFEGWVR